MNYKENFYSFVITRIAQILILFFIFQTNASADLPLDLTASELLTSGIAGRTRIEENVSFGIPLADSDGTSDTQTLFVSDASGNPIESQFRVLRKYPSGNIQWLLVDFLASVVAGSEQQYKLRDNLVTVTRGANLATDSGTQIIINSGSAEFKLDKSCFRGITSVTIGAGANLVDSTNSGGIYIVDDQATRFSSANDCSNSTVIEENGPVRAVIRIEGTLKNDQQTTNMDYMARLSVVKNATAAKLEVSLKNAGLNHRDSRSYVASGLHMALADNSFNYNYADNQAARTGSINQSLIVYQGHVTSAQSGWTIIGDEDCYNWAPPLPGTCSPDLIYSYDTAYSGLLTGIDGQPLTPNGLLFTEGWFKLFNTESGRGVTAVLQNMTAKMGSAMDASLAVDHSNLSVNNYAGPLPFIQHWGGHESFTVLLDFHETASADPRKSWYALQYPLLGRVTDFHHYEKSGAFFGQTQLSDTSEQSQVWAAIGQTEPSASIVSNVTATYTNIVHMRRNFYEVYDDFLDFLRSGYGGHWHHAIDHTTVLANRAIIHSDGYDLSLQPSTADVVGQVGFNPFDGGHAETAGFYSAYYLTGSQWLYDNIIDYGENLLYDQLPSVDYFAIPDTQYWRPWLRKIRNLALAYEFSGDVRYLNPITQSVDDLISLVPDGTTGYSGRGRDIERGFLHMVVDELPERGIHAFFGTQIAGDTWPHILRVLRAEPQTPEMRKRTLDLEDLLLGIAQFTCREAIQYAGHTYAFPNDYWVDRTNVWIPDALSTSSSLRSPKPGKDPKKLKQNGATFDFLGEGIEVFDPRMPPLPPGGQEALNRLYERDTLEIESSLRISTSLSIPGTPEEQPYFAYLISDMATTLYDMLGDQSCLNPALDVSHVKLSINGPHFGAKLQQQKLFNIINHRPPPKFGWQNLTINQISDDGSGNYTLSWTVPPSVEEYRLKYANKPIADWLGYDQTTRQFNLDPANHTLFTAANNIGAVIPLGTPGGTQTYNISLPVSAAGHFALRYRSSADTSNRLPTVDAGADQVVTLPAAGNLSANVNDDGLPNPPANVSTIWSQVSGPSLVSFGDPSALTTSVNFVQDGTYVLRMTANDGTLDTFDEINVAVLPGNGPVNQPPLVDAGTDQTITLPATISLDGTVIDDGLPTNTVTTSWSFSGPGTVSFANSNSIHTSATFSTSGVYELTLMADDGELTTTDQLSVTVDPQNFDTTAPTPNPMTWATMPFAQGIDAITMMATTAIDDSGVVEYYFSCTSGGQGCVDSSWQSSNSYTATGLTAGSSYSFQVMARDAFQNITAASSEKSATTDAETIPNTPSNFSATAISTTQIDLSWINNPANADNLIIDRSQDGVSNWDQIAIIALAPVPDPNPTSYSDSGLDPGTDYYYRLKAENATGGSAYVTSNATTSSLPAFIDYEASGETILSGTVSGNFQATHEDDGVIQSITERDSGGKPQNRYDYLEHRWTFNISAGNVVSLYANAWVTNGTDDNFEFAYSTDGSNYVTAFTVSDSSNNNVQSAILPIDISGIVYVRVKDTDRTRGNRIHQTINVDHIYIRSENAGSGTVPDAPADLFAIADSSSEISLGWTDKSDNESGFTIERSLDGISSWSVMGTAALNAISYTDIGLSSETIYYYRVKAFNGTGDSSYTNSASAITNSAPPASIITSANGYKVKGRHNVDLTWSGATSLNVDIFRNGGLLATVTADDESYTDNIGVKGGATYVYQVCETESTVCSDEVTVIF